MLEIVFDNLKRVFKKRLLGRSGARYTAIIISAPPSVVPSTARLLTTRMPYWKLEVNEKYRPFFRYINRVFSRN
jgi:hypothetical protein